MAAYTQIDCPSCGARIPAEDMHLASMAARCRECHAFVDLRALTQSAVQLPVDPATGRVDWGDPRLAPLPVPQPARITIERHGADLRISRRWFTFKHVFMAFFCVMWNGMLGFFFVTALASGAELSALFLFPLLHVAVGIGLAYATVAGFVNSTVLAVERGHLTVRHGPLPWMGNRDLSTSQIKQLFCEQKITNSRNGRSVTYSVKAMTRNDTAVKLVSGLHAHDEALYVEQEIEKHLGIADQRVTSEMHR